MPRPRPALACALAVGLAACTTAPPAPPPAPASSFPAAPLPAPITSAPHVAEVPAPDAGPAPDPEPPRLDVAAVLFPDAATTPPGVSGCTGVADEWERTRCLFATRYEGDADAGKIALDLYEATGSVAGVQVEQDMDGGFRGHIHLVPEVAQGKHRKHLAWVAAALRDFDGFFARLAAPAKVRYRHRPLALRFFRSVGRTTPSAYAEAWSVSYNVSGSLHSSADAVRETLFHEVFHLNDEGFSARVLRPIFDAIVGRCGTRVACLRPYAPGDTMVRGGTYYAFQPDNGDAVHEYAAELALRWYREQRAVQRGEKLGHPPFKCGPDENRRAWDAMVAAFFGGADAVPGCS